MPFLHGKFYTTEEERIQIEKAQLEAPRQKLTIEQQLEENMRKQNRGVPTSNMISKPTTRPTTALLPRPADLLFMGKGGQNAVGRQLNEPKALIIGRQSNLDDNNDLMIFSESKKDIESRRKQEESQLVTAQQAQQNLVPQKNELNVDNSEPDYKAQNAQLNIKIKELNDALTAKSSEFDGIKILFKQLNTEKESNQKEILSLRQQIQDLQSRMSTNANDSDINQMMQLTAELAQLKNKLRADSSELDKVKGEKNTYQQENVQLRLQLDDINRKVEDFKAQAEVTKTQIASQISEIETQNTQIQQQKQLTQQQQDKISQQDHQILQFTDQIQEQSNKINELMQQLTTVQPKLLQQQAEIKMKDEQILQQVKKIQQLEPQIEVKKVEISDLQEQIQLQNTKISELQFTNSGEQVAIMQQRIQQHELEVARMKQAKSEQEVEMMKIQVLQTNEMMKLREVNHRLQNELTKNQTDLAKARNISQSGICNKCGAQFFDAEDLAEHEATCNRIKCPLCDMKFRQCDQFFEHIESHKKRDDVVSE